jgi:pyruvate formate lyase activating enzyme
MGFLVKFDSNGTNIELLKNLVENKVIDFVALDYKATKEKFFNITKNNDFDKFHESLKFLIEGDIDMEIRTTIHTKLLDENDINCIIDDLFELKYKKVYAIQNFKNTKCLENIGEQEKKLDKTKIYDGKVKIEWRNFNFNI